MLTITLGAASTPATPKKRKGDDAEDTPSKKPKATPKPRGKKAQPPPVTDDELELPQDVDDFFKKEYEV